MKQLLIVKTGTSLNGGASAPKDLSSMADGSIGFFALNDYANWLSAAPTVNFGIALGGGPKQAFVIPEVDVNTLKVTKSAYAAGSAYVASVTIPTPAAGKSYTLVLVKLGTGINGERNKWTQSVYIPAGQSKTANQVAKLLRDGFQAMVDSGSINVTIGGSDAAVTVTGAVGDGWKLTVGDDLYGTAVTETTVGVKTVGDKAYVQDLARQCAANKGFTQTDLESQHIYPGYPEAVEDVHYTVYTLRFATSRVAGKQTDEQIWQYVHIAVPESLTSVISSIDTILANEVALTKTAADELYEPKSE